MMFTRFRIQIFAITVGFLFSPCLIEAEDRQGSTSGRGTRSIQSFMIPHDNESIQTSTTIGGFTERALKEIAGFRVVDLSASFGTEPPSDFEVKRREAKEHLHEGIAHYNRVQFDQAILSLSKALEIQRSQLAWIGRMPEYEETLSYLAASYMLIGNQERGRSEYRDLLLHNRHFEIDVNRFHESMQQIVDEVRDEIERGPVGSISVSSNPPGGRIFVSGTQRGFAPASIDRIPVGNHILRIEQIGTFPHGEMIRVTPTEDSTFRINLKPTKEFQELQNLVSAAGAELASGNVGRSMIRLGRGMNLEWAIFGLVQRSVGTIQVNAWVVNINQGTRLAARRFDLPGTDFNLEAEVRQMVTTLLDDAARRQSRGSEPSPSTSRAERDPRPVRDSVEESPRPPRERRERPRRSRRSGDPLDEKTGTEDW